MESSGPAQTTPATDDKPVDQARTTFIGEAGAAQPASAAASLSRGEAARDDSLLGMPKLAALALVLALLAGAAAFLVRARGRQ